jgi:hypothetical protein
MNSRIYASTVCGTLLAGSSLACDLCSIYSAAQAHGEIGEGVFAGVAEQFTHFGTLLQDGSKIENTEGQYLNSSISQLFVGYNFTERFGIQFNVPVIARWYRRADHMGGIERGHVRGIGDVAALAHFQVYRHETKDMTLSWTLIGGVKFPSGSTRFLHEEVDEFAAEQAEMEEEGGDPSSEPEFPHGAVHGHDLSLGSGSLDGIVGTSIFARQNRFFFGGNVQYAIRTKGNFDYQFADDLTWVGGPGAYLFLEDKYTVGLQWGISGEVKGRDRFMGRIVEDSGLTAIYMGPQLLASWKDNLSAELGVDLPVVRDNTALQIVPSYRVRAGLTWHF